MGYSYSIIYYIITTLTYFNMYNKFFPGKNWDFFTNKISKKLITESILISGLPLSGLNTYHNHLLKLYKTEPKELLVNIDILKNTQSINSLSNMIKSKISNINHNYELDIYILDLIDNLISDGYSILFFLNNFHNIRTNREIQNLLFSIRAIDSLKIRFLITSDISCLTSPQDYEKVSTLISANVYILPTLTKNEIQLSLSNYKKLYGWEVDPKYSKQILHFSGGVCGLVKYIAKEIHENNLKEISNSKLLEYPSIKLKIEGIYNTLEENDLIVNKKLNLEESKLLKKLGVVDLNNNLRIKLLNPYLSERPDRNGDFHKHIKKTLSSREIKLFEYLRKSDNKVRSKDEIADQIWEEKVDSKYSQWAVYKAIANLKKKIEKFGYKIKNYRGRGYSLTKE